MLRRLSLIPAALLLVTSLRAQLQVKNHFSFTGKKDVAVNAVTQDATGFLVVATAEGAFRFDGRRAEPLCRSAACLRQEITALLADGEALYLGTRTGKVFTVKGDRVDSVDFGKEANDARITSFYKSTGGIFFGTYGNGIYRMGPRLQHYPRSAGLSDDVVYKITGDGQKLIWCGTDAGITEISDPDGRPRFSVISGKNGLPDNIVRDIRYEKDRLLISMQDSGVCYFNFSSRSIIKPTFFSNWSHGPVLGTHSDGGKKLVVATEKNGLLIIDNGIFHIYRYADHQLQAANQMFTDQTGQIWIASKRGLSQFQERRFHFITAAGGLPDDTVAAITSDRDQALWIGSGSGIAKLMRNEHGKIVSAAVDGSNRFNLSCAATAADGMIWFGTYGSGIVITDPHTRKLHVLDSKNSPLPNDNIGSIYSDSSGQMLISTLGGGLVRARLQPDGGGSPTLGTVTIFDESNGLGSNYVYAAITGKDGNVLVATDGGGLQLLEGDTFIDLTKNAGLKTNSVFSLCRDASGIIWATSNADGILRYDGRGLTALGRSAGLRDEQPQQLIASGDFVFAVHPKGIDRINCRTAAISYYDFYDGDAEPNLNAICVQGGRFYSGTTHGILVFRTSSESSDSVKPSVYISSIQLNYKPFPMDSIREFSHNQNNFSFSFGGIWLRNPEKLQFRYRLRGLESDWLTSGEGKMVNYNNLNPGSYEFQVQARNDEEVWSDMASFSFTVLTPLWKRWWFWAIVAAVAALLLYTFVSYRLKTLQKENLLLEHRVKERTAQIEKQSRIIEKKNLELEQLSLVASKTDNVVLILDAEARLEYVNESFVRLHNLSQEEAAQLYGQSIYELSNNPNIRGIVTDAIRGRKSVSYESLNKKTSVGREIWESSTLTPIFDEHGLLRKIIIIDTDVSERKKQEQIILQKNKDITDSISYARKIQHAILPDLKMIRGHLPHSFVLYMTKDIVSGDFYWFNHIDGHSIIAAVDCTGHGVPGAFMSLIGHNLLNRIINEKRITEPAAVLLELNRGVLEALHKNESESKDGMDIAICKIDHKAGTLEFAGAMRPLWIVNNHVLTEVRADKIPIGTAQPDRTEKISYTTHRLPVKPGDRFYIFTDGYADQFGGDRDKKYSTARLKKLLSEISDLDLEKQEESLRTEHLRWKGELEQIDDILIIGFSA